MRENALQLRDVEVRHADEGDLALIPAASSASSMPLRSSPDCALAGSPATRASESDTDRFARSAGGAGSVRLPVRIDSRLQAVRRVAAGVPDEAALGEHVRPLAARNVPQRPADDFLGMAEAVDGGGVDPVEAELDRAPNRGDRVRVVLRSPSEPPFAADGPGAQADGSECRVTICRAFDANGRDIGKAMSYRETSRRNGF